MISGTPWRLVDIDDKWLEIGPLVAGVDPMDNAGDELRQCCRDGKAMCLTSDDGVMVLSLEPDRYGHGELELFVRLAASWGEKGSIQRAQAHLDAIARDLGATKIVCQSVHPWMQKALGPQWAIRHVTYERAVNGI